MGSGASHARYEPTAESTPAASTPVAASEKARRAITADQGRATALVALYKRRLRRWQATSARAPINAALRFGKQFEMTTPMLVMPFGVFKAQGRIMKSTKAWRDEALAAGSQDRHLHLAHVVGPVLQGRGLELNV